MAIAFRLLPHRNLIVVTYSGIAGIDETTAGAEACARDPDFRPHMRHLVDVRAITGWERDFPGFMAMQARVMEVFPYRPNELLIVFLATTPAGREMAHLVARSWDGLDAALLRIAEDEATALALLGLPERSLADLTAPAG